MPAQPGTAKHMKSAHQVCVANKPPSGVFTPVVGPAHPGLRAGETTSRSGVATQSHYRLCAPAPDE
eukprot:1066211-Amphidinium_carterae.1